LKLIHCCKFFALTRFLRPFALPFGKIFNPFIQMRILSVVLLCAITSCQPQTENYLPTIDLYMLIGDSNQNGATYEPEGLAVDSSLIENQWTLIYYKPDRSSQANGQWQPYSIRPTANANYNRVPGYARTNETQERFSLGQDQSFVQTWSKARRKIVMIKMARGGSTLLSLKGLENDWMDDDLFETLIDDFYYPAIEELHSRGYRANLKGVLIRLGTNDCNATLWKPDEFSRRVEELITDLREDTNSDPNIYWIQINNNLPTSKLSNYPSEVVNKARAIIEAKSRELNFHTIYYDTCALQSDGVHYTADAYKWQGIYEASLF
jgi:hypothetical protein